MKDELVASIQTLCVSRGLKLSFAESCTGGHLAARLTGHSGSSQYFLGSIVAYTNELKIKLLGVNSSVLDLHGVYSGPVVEQMAQGVLTLTGSDISVAVSGIAGPGGELPGKPVGTIWAAIAIRNETPVVWSFRVTGSRQEIIDQSVEILLLRLKCTIEQILLA